MRQKGVRCMSALESQILQSLSGLSDDSLHFILDMIQRVVMPADAKTSQKNAPAQPGTRRLGSMKGQKFIADGHDIGDYDDEIAQMFGAVTE